MLSARVVSAIDDRRRSGSVEPRPKLRGDPLAHRRRERVRGAQAAAHPQPGGSLVGHGHRNNGRRSAPIGHGPVLSRLWDQPAITITGIDAPTVLNASNTLVPSVTVKVSARIAPGQSSADAYEAGYYERAYEGLRGWVTEDFPFTDPFWSNAELPGN